MGSDYVVSHHSWMKSLNSIASTTVHAFDNGQVPSDMARFTEASMRMIGTILMDDRNNVRKEPVDNLLSQYYQTEMQITNVDQVRDKERHAYKRPCFIAPHHAKGKTLPRRQQ